MNPLLYVICLALQIYYIILLVRILLAWIPSLPDPLRPVARGLHAITDPLLIPLRRVIPPVQMGAMALDLSPIVLFIGIILLQSILC
ncbi:MAG: YggT family protein [Egibacteraceae bacterium]